MGYVIGFVHVRNEMEQESVMVGVGKGISEIADAQHISEWGGRLTESQARGFFPEIKNYRK